MSFESDVQSDTDSLILIIEVTNVLYFLVVVYSKNRLIEISYQSTLFIVNTYSYRN